MPGSGLSELISTRTRSVAMTASVALVAVCALAAGSASATDAKLRVLPEAFGEPARLAPGSYRTRPGFTPMTTFTVGQGWYGSGPSTGEQVAASRPLRGDRRSHGRRLRRVSPRRSEVHGGRGRGMDPHPQGWLTLLKAHGSSRQHRCRRSGPGPEVLHLGLRTCRRASLRQRRHRARQEELSTGGCHRHEAGGQ